MKLKICGISDHDSFNACEKAGVDFIGFVFAKSKRQVSLETATNIIKNKKNHNSKIVAVFKDMTIAEIMTIVDKLNPDYIQLHDPLPIPFPQNQTISVVHYPNPIEALTEHLLVDSPVAGSGMTFDWKTLHSAPPHYKLWVAGGLSIHTLPKLLSQYTPYAIDVSSGVETQGKKDIQKIIALTNYIQEVNNGIHLSR